MPSGLPDFLQSYDVIGKLREGGMGAIYRVRHRLLGQDRIVKILRPQFGDDVEFQTRFLREAQLVAALRHPNIALLYEFALADSGAGSIVMEFIDGASLKDVLECCGAPSLGLSVEIAHQALGALDYLHRGGVLHRDISPDNLMLTRERDGAPLVKLIDLGIAKRFDETQQTNLTGTGHFLGKLRYASPEQFGMEAGERLDARTDLYSFGIVLYELLTGRFPIRGDDSSTLVAGHLFHPPLPFAESDPEGLIPDDLRAVVIRALAKDRERRFASAAEFRAALEVPRRRFVVDAAEVERLLIAAAPAQPAAGSSEDLSLALSGSGTPIVGGVAGQSTRGTLAAATARAAPRADGDAPTVLFAASPAAEPLAPPAASPAPQTLLAAEPQRRRSGRLVVTAVAGVLLAALVAAVLVIAPWKRGAPATDDEAPILAALAEGRAYALVVGNDNYQRLPRLRSAVADATAVGDLLASRYGFAVERLSDATRDQMVTALDSYRARLRPADRLLVFFAGHGGREHGDTEVIGYWQPVDAGPSLDYARSIPNSEVTDYLKGFAARQVLVLADSCYAGTINPESLAPPPAAATAEARLRERERVARLPARLAMTSGGDAPIVEPGAGNRSLFAGALLAVLEENPGLLGSAELYSRLRQRMEPAAARQGNPQSPTYGVIPGAGDNGGDFFFAPSDTLKPFVEPAP